MELTRRTIFVYGLLFALWAVVVVWQAEEHARAEAFAKTALRNRSKAIANTLGASIRGLQFRGAIFGDRLQPILKELVNGRTNELGMSAEVTAIYLLNAAGEPVASVGNIDLEQKDILQEGERWGNHTVTFVYPIEGANVSPEGATNPPQPLLLLTNSLRDGGRSFNRRERPEPSTNNASASNAPPAAEPDHPPPPLPDGSPPPDRENRPPDRDFRPRRPFWARGLNDKDYQALIEKRELHGLVLAMPLDAFQAFCLHDLWLRFVIGFFATLSVVGSSLAWRNLTKSSDLQIRLVRASELNTHLREMNLAAAGLAHETRNPLNIIRGRAQMISKLPNAAPDIRERSLEIIDEADKVAAQLNEFINYSRPREVRRTPLAISSVINEVVRALSYDLEEKKISLQSKGETLTIEADEQLLRQALFNLLLNAIQAVDTGGELHVSTEKRGATEAVLEVRDNGPGVPPERRAEIFKPYFTTQKTGTGLGLAVVQQIVLAHGWEIECLANEPKGAVFRITHLKLAA
jgi:signal transduction histidine kinase